MFYRSLLIGLVVTLALLALLGVTRLINAPQAKVVELTELEVIELEEEPPPPDLSDPEEPEDLPPPPTPAIDLSALTDDLDAPEIALSPLKVDLTTPIEAFQTDQAIAKIPILRKAQPPATPAPRVRVRPTPKPKKRPAPPKPTVAKAYYSESELDSGLRIIRNGSFSWPPRAKGTSGRVRLKIEINESGRVRILSLISASDPALVKVARRVATGTRFSSPRKNGQRVKVRYTKTWVLKKP